MTPKVPAALRSALQHTSYMEHLAHVGYTLAKAEGDPELQKEMWAEVLKTRQAVREAVETIWRWKVSQTGATP